MRTVVMLLLGFGLTSLSSDLTHGQESSNKTATVQDLDSNQDADISDPTLPSKEILRRIPQNSAPNAEDLLNSAKRLQEAGLTEQARKRVTELQELKNAPLEIKDEAAIWWASVEPIVKEPKTTEDPKRPVVQAPLPKPKPVALPKIPKIVIRALVMKSADAGTALLEVDGRQISIPLIPLDQQKRMPIPKGQFAEWEQPSMENLPADSSKQAEIDNLEKEKAKLLQFCPDCSFLNESVIFNLESFGKNTIVLNALPHNKLILVRVEN